MTVVVFDAVVVFAQADQVPDRGRSPLGERDDVVGFASGGAPGAAGEAAVPVAVLHEAAHRGAGPVGVGAGLDQDPGVFVEQDPGDLGVEAVQDRAHPSPAMTPMPGIR